eukprot:Skav216710  [mRNA]  locus=scaffold91:629187:631632:+ [translate_table: standard]
MARANCPRPRPLPATKYPIQSDRTIPKSGTNQLFTYRCRILRGRYSITPSEKTNPVMQDIAMSKVQKKRVNQSRKAKKVVSSNVKQTSKGTKMMS